MVYTPRTSPAHLTMVQRSSTLFCFICFALLPGIFAEYNRTQWIVKIKPDSFTKHTSLRYSSLGQNKTKCKSQNPKHRLMVLEVEADEDDVDGDSHMKGIKAWLSCFSSL